jgi:hypothetical protein
VRSEAIDGVIGYESLNMLLQERLRDKFKVTRDRVGRGSSRLDESKRDEDQISYLASVK